MAGSSRPRRPSTRSAGPWPTTGQGMIPPADPAGPAAILDRRARPSWVELLVAGFLLVLERSGHAQPGH
ncbi:hypothetical protein KBY58_02760 [Cyanobium sp. HWJ4-Hawea]|uniref:hypothetical protein n=1 Tax=Cyanobium sp. HWJ4-Hawea TaxID=2823713 RepID=UPI0020CBEC7C|nr:hypothetical protein [Cyanobium sp. HWJ4-Hawea]MCP9808352.1 hypothetical protein [Cyanobium sp. HWJ4-Hawea]